MITPCQINCFQNHFSELLQKPELSILYYCPLPFSLSGNILTPPEFFAVLKKIVDSAPIFYGKSISALTCLERDDWADAREYMINRSAMNEQNLKDIEDAVICFCLDESKPKVSISH